MPMPQYAKALLDERYRKVIDYFQEAMPTPEPELRYRDPYSLLVAVILSAQCTDVRVNAITPALLHAYPTPAAMAAATPSQVFPYISSCSYPNAKADHLVGMAKGLVERFNGNVPTTEPELITLPGVGRKTANVVRAVAFGQAAFAVDTHVHRVARRFGLTQGAKTPDATEQQLTAHIPKELWRKAHHWFILHGRYVCQARRPKCSECGLADFCPRVGVES